MVVGGNGDSIYSRLMAAVGRQDMAADNPNYENNSRRCEREEEINEVRFGPLCDASTGAVEQFVGFFDSSSSDGAVICVCGVHCPRARSGSPTALRREPRRLMHSTVTMMQVIGSWIMAHSLEEVLGALKTARVPAGPILSTADIVTDEQYQQRGMFQRVRPPSGATVRWLQRD